MQFFNKTGKRKHQVSFGVGASSFCACIANTSTVCFMDTRGFGEPFAPLP